MQPRGDEVPLMFDSLSFYSPLLFKNAEAQRTQRSATACLGFLSFTSANLCVLRVLCVKNQFVGTHFMIASKSGFLSSDQSPGKRGGAEEAEEGLTKPLFTSAFSAFAFIAQPLAPPFPGAISAVA